MSGIRIDKIIASIAVAALSGQGGCAEGEYVIYVKAPRRLGLIVLRDLLSGGGKVGRSHA